MRVLVTGGAGFIGSHVVARLLEHEHRVRVIDDLSSGRREHVPKAAEFIEASVTDPAALRAATHGVDAVVHLAAIASVTRSVEAPSATHEVNLAATIRLAEAAVGARVPKLVYASSAAVYGFIERTAHHEDDPVAPATPYAIDKYTGETYLRFFAAEHGLDVRVLRFFNVYGPRQLASSPYAGVIARFAIALLGGEPLIVYGDGEQTRDFIYVGDVAAIVARHALEEPTPGRVDLMNVCNGSRTSLHDLIGALAKATGATSDIRYEVARSGDIRHSRGAPALLGAWFPKRPRTGLETGLGRVVDWMRAS
jgi:UDP-glucose 4-epimerase